MTWYLIYHDLSPSSEKYGRCTVGLWRQPWIYQTISCRLRPRAPHDIKKLQYNAPNNCNVSQQNTCLVHLKYTSTQASPWFTYNSPVPLKDICSSHTWDPGGSRSHSRQRKKPVVWLASNRFMFQLRKYRWKHRPLGGLFFVNPPPCAVLASWALTEILLEWSTDLGMKESTAFRHDSFPSKKIGHSKKTTTQQKTSSSSSSSSSKSVQKTSLQKKWHTKKKTCNQKKKNIHSFFQEVRINA